MNPLRTLLQRHAFAACTVLAVGAVQAAPAWAQRLEPAARAAQAQGATLGGVAEAQAIARALGAIGTPDVARSSAGPLQPRTVFVFGDSLSDTGNAYALHYGLFSAWFSAPYALPRFSNGPMWPDHLADLLGKRITPSSAGGSNYATGSATISPDNYYSRLPEAAGFAQVDRFLAAHPVADPRAIYVVWLGSNDIDPPAAFTEWNAAQLATLLGRLHAAGARNFLVANLFDLGKVPNIVRLGFPDYARQLSEMTVLFNQRVAGLAAQFPQARVQVADVYRLRQLVDRYPAVFGFVNTTEPCYEVYRDRSVCARPDRYWYWDENHPTTHGHRLLASLFALELLKVGMWRPMEIGAAR